MFFQGNEKYNCATYLRLSRSDGDQQESNSIKNQRALLNDYMGKHPELHKFDEYVDDGYSGTNFERPDFKRMIQDIENRKINCIIVKDLSRFGRNYIETGRYLERIFPFMGVRFIAINDHYKMLGYRITFEGETLYVFDLLVPEIFHEGQRKKNAVDSQDNAASTKPVNSRKGFYLDDIVGTFGVPVEEHRKESEVKQMDGYVSMGILTGKIAPEAGKD